MKKFLISDAQNSKYGRTIYINPLPQKACTFDCVFCPLEERTKLKTDKSVCFEGTTEFLLQLEESIANQTAEAVFISANGEALINKQLIDIIKLIKEKGCKAIIISNGYIFDYEEYRSVLNLCDVVIGELMASNESDFQRLLRPIEGYTLDKHVSNLESFNKQYEGQFELCITILKSCSDNEEALEFFRIAVERIKPDFTFIETPSEEKFKILEVDHNIMQYFKEKLMNVKTL